ncbi:hypothetical protein JYK14_04540 [Siccirubricoccus sp. KC 17139]|uniref:Tetratricopeptide repeat protein n=1 Tax=Siccirubricoccus soli TaxID=2899147 RepID=A0ABT1D0K7_9PROT|nr:tetratricopeptide repeat protein [Siccirubricoccus soli]MCO6415446.1 hypothetical protein [Siccirubricoccus soli]MCP2681578.1 hypothetical protein [Siccirubricoccus soli]
MTVDAPGLPSRCHLDQPTGPLVATAPFTLAGWAIGPGALQRVRVSVNGSQLGDAETGLVRPDVAAHFAAYPHAGRSGFQLTGLRLPPGTGTTALLRLEVEFAAGAPLLVEQAMPVGHGATAVLLSLRQDPPASPAPLLAAAARFTDEALLEEAEALLAVAVARFPEEPVPRAAYAALAVRAAGLGLWPEAEATRRLALLRRCFSDNAAGTIEAARALASAGLDEEAEALLADLPPSAEGLMLLAGIAERQAHKAGGSRYLAAWEKALARWEAVLDLMPEDAAALTGAGTAALRTNRPSKGAAILARAVAWFPDNPELAMWHAHAATLIGQPEEALARFARLRAAFPGFTGGQSLEGEARFLAGRAPPNPGEAAGDRALLLQFEALGSNCEFGNVQRAFGAEPLGLFRFSSGSAAEIAQALEMDLAGIGAPEHTFFEILPEPRPEYWVGDRRWHFRAHTFTYPEQVPDAAAEAALFEKHCKRLQFLRRKLLEDLAEGEKILVHAEYGPPRPEARQRLFRAVRRHGPNTLLYVVLADAAHPSGTLEVLEPGLMLGRLDGFIGVHRDTVNYADWLALCRAAHVVWQGWRQA